MHAPHDHKGHGHDPAHDHGAKSAGGHDHKHSHGPGGHSHGPLTFDRAFAIGITLNILFVIAEFGTGFVAQSVALMADAGHNLSDVLGLCVAWAGATLAKTLPSKRFTYGLKGSTILAAMLNALLLLMAMGAIVFEAVQRIGEPANVKGMVVVVVAAVGILVNAATAWLFARGQKSDINLRGAYLHMAADATVSAGVMLAGLAIWWTGAAWIDPVTSIVVSILIFWQTWGLLRETVEMSLNAVPRAIDFDQVTEALSALPGVSAIHDLHIWPMSTTETVLTAHLVMAAPAGESFLTDAQKMLHDRFAIGHATIQIERDGNCGTDC
ncbi:cation diffusion facilitator family transporter [Sphingomonas bacterium]|uniref:cation diffusion facilitator family transporter n=1 Tax=Sphingomonas bacterium TaxID=1895847 RepID=UPI0026144EC1|nr:cation diffusion facilitator family transporter [Sphingomonas bacterium]MDB5677797.1 cation transporter [Sphingomonas bacterium]